MGLKTVGCALASILALGLGVQAQAHYGNHYARDNGFYNLSPYIGADFKYWHTSLEGDYNGTAEFENILHKDYYGGAVYGGLKWCDMLGLEVGYESTDKRSKILDTGVAATTETHRIRFQGVYADLNGYYPIYDCLSLIGSIGVVHLDPKASLFIPGTPTTDVDGRARTVFRAGLGLQYMITNYIGTRGLVRWENTSRLRVDVINTATGGVTNTLKPFRDSVTANVGLFVSFM